MLPKLALFAGGIHHRLGSTGICGCATLGITSLGAVATGLFACVGAGGVVGGGTGTGAGEGAKQQAGASVSSSGGVVVFCR